MPRTYVFRLTAEGVKELERDFKAMGETGERAFAELAARVPGLEGATAAANRRLDEMRENLSETPSMIGRVDTSLQSLMNRYLSFTAIIVTAQRAMRTAAETNADAASAIERLDKAWEGFAQKAAVQLTPIVNEAARLLGVLNEIADLTQHGDWSGAFSKFLKELSDHDPDIRRLLQLYERVTGTPALRVEGVTGGVIGNTIATLDKKTGDYTPGPYGFAESGVTDLTALAKAREDAAKKAKEIADREQKETLARIQQEYEWYVKFYDDKRALADKSRADNKAAEEKFNKDIHAQIIELSQQGLRVEQENARERQALYDEDDRRAKERLDRIHGYWTDTLDAMTNDGASFFENFFESGEADLNDFIGVFKRAWSRLLADLATQQFVAPIMRSVLGTMGPLVGQVAGGGAPSGLLGGSSFGGIGAALGLGGGYATSQGWIPSSVAITPAQGLSPAWFSGGFGSALGGGFAGLGLGSITGMIGGNTTGGAIGGALGGALGNFILPGVGGLVGGALGGLVGGMVGGKPSDYRSVATFGPGGSYAVGAQSAHETSQQTLTLAQQAAAAIQQQVSELQAFGVEFQRQLANIWIGQRDPSSFQLVGGQRISVGTVGDAGDLAQDVLAALMQGATSSDPIVAQQLARGGSMQDIVQALTFAKGIETSLKQITDPLGAAIDLWKQESQARLDMAAATGVSIEKVQQLNAALYGQIVNQANQGVVNNIGGYLSSLDYGPGSIAPPGKQYEAALADYEKARAAAMGGGAAEAQAYLEATQQFLPFAREYLGTTQAYAGLESTARSTLESLSLKLSAPPTMPDLVIPLVNATTTTGALTVEAVEGVSAKVQSLTESVDRAFGEMNSLLRQLKTA